MWWRVAISLAFHSALSSELVLYVTVADRIRWEHFHWRENHGAQIPTLSPTGLVIQFVLTAFHKIRVVLRYCRERGTEVQPPLMCHLGRSDLMAAGQEWEVQAPF